MQLALFDADASIFLLDVRQNTLSNKDQQTLSCIKSSQSSASKKKFLLRKKHEKYWEKNKIII